MALSFFKNINLQSVSSRFPIPILCSTIMAILLIVLVEDIYKEDTFAFEVIVRSVLTLAIGFLVFTIVQLCIERYKPSSLNKSLLYVFATVLLLAYSYFYSRNFSDIDLVKFFGLFAALALIITVVPYTRKGNFSDFWHFNKNLLLRFVETGFYTLFIFGSVSIALLALDKLFGINFRGVEIYVHLFLLLTGVFFPISFFSRIPTNFSFPDKPEVSSAFLLFAQKILIPIVNLYATILIAYAAKILILWSWPKGWISNMIIWFSVFGIFTYVLNYLIINNKSNAYLRGFKKYFFPFLLPFAIMLLLAVGRRISDYGITEKRYIVASLGVWLLLISIYFIISKKDNIKIIPTTLSFLILFNLLGPFNMFELTLNSQFDRLEKLLSENNILRGNKIYKAKGLIRERQQRIYDMINTVDSRGGLYKINRWENGDADIKSLIDSIQEVKIRAPEFVFNRYYKLRNQPNSLLLAKELELTKISKYNTFRNSNQFYFYGTDHYNISVSDFDEMIHINYNGSNTKLDTVYAFNLIPESDSLQLMLGEVILDKIAIKPFIDGLQNTSPGEKLIWDYKNEYYRYQFHFNNISGEENNGNISLHDVNGFALLKKRGKNE
jgi:hypothetical protein